MVMVMMIMPPSRSRSRPPAYLLTYIIISHAVRLGLQAVRGRDDEAIKDDVHRDYTSSLTIRYSVVLSRREGWLIRQVGGTSRPAGRKQWLTRRWYSSGCWAPHC